MTATWWTTTLLALAVACAARSAAQDMNLLRYDMGSPTLHDIWVDPVSGDDARSGNTRTEAVRTVREAWNRIPRDVVLSSTGYRIALASGTYPDTALPNYLEYRYGTAQCPVILMGADGPGTAVLFGGALNVFETRYFYVIDLDFVNDPGGFGGGDVLHFERCDHVLVRTCRVDGGARMAHETIKVNQSRFVYIEDSDVHGAEDNAIDWVAVQYGHIAGNRIHDAQDWCMYTKGGSANIRIEGNEIFDGGGGYTAGQGTGFQFMSDPWLHYEAYNVKAVNNVVHDVAGAALGVQGGYNILFAYNTMYRIGAVSHLLEIGYGSRSCDGQPGDPGRDSCDGYLARGGWGTTVVDDGTNFARVPNRNVFVYDNVFYNPPGTRSGWQHLMVAGVYDGESQRATNIPSPVHADDDLQIRGNVIWNGPVDYPLGLDASSGCPDANPTCNEAQLRAENAINAFEPEFTDAAHDNFRPRANGNLFGATTFVIPPFPGDDRPLPPLAPDGNYANTIVRDITGAARTSPSPPGAWAGATPTSARADPVPVDARIETNYPNPFAPATTIRYTLFASGTVRFAIVDASGRVATAADAGFEDAGPHEFRLDTRGLAPGTYVLALEFAGRTVLRKALRVR